MRNTEVIAVDRFAYSMKSILDDIDKSATMSLEKPVREACKIARDEAKEEAPRADVETLKIINAKHRMKKGRYYDGFAYRVSSSSKRQVVGEIGNKKYPGLVHLLENGHAIMGGGRAQAFPHMAPAADKAFKEFEQMMAEELDNNL